MGEAIISRGFSGSNGGGTSGENGNFRTEIITASTLWKVPENLKDGTVSVRIFGGGGGGNYQANSGGGAGGYMNNDTINLNGQSEIYITIGSGGAPNSYGGTTSFGTYLSALGGRCGYDGDGGSGGSGGGGSSYGGTGYQFGGGGAIRRYGGPGGKWGGGGGHNYNNDVPITRGGCLYEDPSNSNNITGYSGLGGNGGSYRVKAESGINTIGLNLDFEGPGTAGAIMMYDILNNLPIGILSGSDANCKCGGGGYGGKGGHVKVYTNTTNTSLSSINGYGGGGGYGANGGNGYFCIYNACYGCGGGGGYGGDGGDSGCLRQDVGTSDPHNYIIFGGGGGYGKYGKGGGFDINNNCVIEAGIAAGGHGCAVMAKGGFGGPGICIIQYYVK